MVVALRWADDRARELIAAAHAEGVREGEARTLDGLAAHCEVVPRTCAPGHELFMPGQCIRCDQHEDKRTVLARWLANRANGTPSEGVCSLDSGAASHPTAAPEGSDPTTTEDTSNG